MSMLNRIGSLALVFGVLVCFIVTPLSPAGAQPIQDGTYLEHVDDSGGTDTEQQKYWPLATGFAVLFLVLFAVYRFRQTTSQNKD